MKRAVMLSLAALLTAAIVAVSAMIHGAGGFQLNGFYPWVLAPYCALGFIFSSPRTQSDARSVAGALAGIAVLVMTALLYVNAMWFSYSSTSSLVFVFGPIYIALGGLGVWGLVWLVLRILWKNRGK